MGACNSIRKHESQKEEKQYCIYRKSCRKVEVHPRQRHCRSGVENSLLACILSPHFQVQPHRASHLYLKISFAWTHVRPISGVKLIRRVCRSIDGMPLLDVKRWSAAIIGNRVNEIAIPRKLWDHEIDKGQLPVEIDVGFYLEVEMERTFMSDQMINVYQLAIRAYSSLSKGGISQLTCLKGVC